MMRCAIPSPPGVRPAKRKRAAFTLLEIILAIGLATGLLLVALTFYHQAADMRGQVLRELDQLSSLRLVLDRVAGDLRTAQSKAEPGNEFVGDSTSLSFVKQAFVAPPTAASGADPTDLLRITFSTVLTTNGTQVVANGLERNETSLNAPPVLAPALDLGSNLVAEVVDTNGAVLTNASSFPAPQKEPFGDLVRFVRFRYWDGSAWQAGWTNASPPAGVEVILGLIPNAEDAEPDALPREAYRRVVFVPGGTTRPAPDPGSPPDLAISAPPR